MVRLPGSAPGTRSYKDLVMLFNYRRDKELGVFMYKKPLSFYLVENCPVKTKGFELKPTVVTSI